MYLKEIITNGFKSFADKMTIALDDQITCIVGPNGSGKSNVVDAVRWVLGEQSVKSLRGAGSMSDVIFAGSASRKAKNAASVELVFDNSDHYLNINYTEVSIKRRVFRSGENEYYINQERCRLKDIINLFLDSGVGRESFNIISQGEVQKILSESKEDRRAIFEEAAGILKYKKRKEEALRKLDRTHDSLDRVEDIILELEVQVKPLKEQSEKAKDYLENKENLEKLEIALLAYDIYQLDQEKQLLLTKQEQLQMEITKLMNTTTVASSDTLKLKTEQLQKEQVLAVSQSELLKAAEDVVSLNGELTLLRAQRDANDQEEKTQKSRQLYIEKASIEKQLALLTEKTTNLQEEIIKKKQTLEEYQQRLNRLKLERKQLEQDYSKVDRDSLSYQHKIELLQQEEERGTNLPQAVRTILQDKNLTGIYDRIGNVVKVKDNLARALDVALTSSKNFIIVQDENSAKAAIEYLKNKRLGRATFFPLTVIQKRYVDQTTLHKLNNQPGFLGVLADLVTCDPLYQNIIYNQLGLVLVAEDMDAALFLSKVVEKRYKIVTLAGDVINVGGSMTGGSFYQGRSSITIHQEIATLTANLEEAKITRNSLIDKLTTQKEKIEKIEEAIFQLVQQNTSYNEQQQDLKREQETLETQLTNLKNQLENLESTTDDLAKKETDIIDQFYQKSAEKEKLENKINKLQQELAIIKKQIEDIEADNKYQNSLLRQQEEEKNRVDIRLSRIDVQLDTMLDTLSTDYSMTYEKARKDYSLDMEVEEARPKVQFYKNNIKNLGMVNLAAIEEYERVSSRYEFLLHQKEDLEKAQGTLLEIMNEMDEVMKEEFLRTFEEIRQEFKQVFKELFHGGTADLQLSEPEDLLTTGIDIIASPPGKKLSTINLLSGGEKTLTAISLLFAILNIRIVPFCIFDEVEAALDEANVDQFGHYLAHYKDKTQFLIITHKKKTMEYADTLYGITMQESGVSKLVSVKLTTKEELI